MQAILTIGIWPAEDEDVPMLQRHIDWRPPAFAPNELAIDGCAVAGELTEQRRTALYYGELACQFARTNFIGKMNKEVHHFV